MMITPRFKQVLSALAVLSPLSSLWAASANNNYANATVLNGNNFSVSVDVTGNTKQSGEANHGGLSFGGKSAWWSWTPAISGVYQIDTAGSAVADTLLAIYSDSVSYPVTATPYATLLAQNNDVDASVKSSSCRLRAVAGTVYKIAVDTNSNAVGLVTLNIAPATGVPSNDERATAEPITGIGVITQNGSTVGASVNSSDPILHFERGHQPTAWYSYTPSSDRIAKISVTAPSSYTPEYGVYDVSGNRLGGPFPVSMTAGTTYYIAVAGVPVLTGIILNGTASSQQGTFTLKIETESLAKSVVMPAGQTWEWLHPLNAANPTTDPNWASNWRIMGDTSTVPAWNTAAPAPFGYSLNATTLMVDLAPGAKTNIGTPVPTPTSEHAAYFRRKFTLSAPVSRLSAKILADDGAYIYIDNLAGVAVNIRLTAGVPDADAFLTSACQAANATATETSLKDVDLTNVLGGELSAGEHTIAVSLHQASSTGSDAAFDLQLLETKLSAGTQLADIGSIETGFQEPAAGAKTFTRSGVQKELNWKITTDVAENPVTTGAVTRGSVRAESDIVDSTSANNAAFQIAGSTNKFLMTRGLRYTTGSPAGFTATENIDVNGVAKFSVSCKVRAFTTSGTGFEAADNLRVFLETSSDGTTFDGTLDILPLTTGGNGGTDPLMNATGPGAPNTPYLDWKTHGLVVTGNTAKAVRFRMVGGSDSTSENILLDDVRFSLPNPQVLLTPPVVVRENFNNDNPADDQFTVSTQVTGDQVEPSTGWITSSVSAPNPTSGTYGSSTVTFGPFPVSGGTKTIFINDSGNPLVSAALFGVPPVTTVTVAVNGDAVLNSHGTPANTADDTVDVELLVNATYGSTGWTLPAAPGTSGTYGVPKVVSVPFITNPILITVADRAEPGRTDTISLFFLKMGTVSSNGTPNDLIASHIPSGATAIQWYNSTPTVLKHDGNLILQAFTSGPIALPVGGSEATFAATLYANETSTGTNFEIDDTFKIELLLTAADTSVSTLNLVQLNSNVRPSDGLSYDRNGNGVYNGYDASDLSLDEFNGNQVAWGTAMVPGGLAEITIPIGLSFNTSGYVSARVKVTGGCNSASEHFTLSAMSLNYVGVEVDSDHDGLDDEWELNYFGTLAQGPLDDADGDGNSNYTEFVAGLNPTDPAENIRINSLTKSGGNLTVTWSSLPGKSYQLRYSPNLQGTWETLPAIIPGEPGTTTVTAPIPGPVGVKGFVEVIVLP